MIHTIDVFSSSISFTEEDVRNKIVVVIDVLRACSTIQTALENGATEIIPVPEKDDAGKYSRFLDSSGLLMCGEKDGIKMEGFHLGNSPLEYIRETVEKKTLIFKTSNGTRAITRSSNAKEVLIGSLLNMSAIGKYLKNQSSSDVILICSGWRSRLSIEDFVCAGGIVSFLYDKKLPDNAMDGTKVAFGLYEKFGSNLRGLVLSSNHAKRLKKIGFEKDVDYCSQLDLYSSIPVLNKGVINLM